MSISILILNYRTKNLLRQALRGIYRYPPTTPFEVIVVDNGSGDGSVAMVRASFPLARCIALPENIGYARGSNIGLAAASGDTILLMNSDIITLSGSIDRLYAYLRAHPEVGAAGPRLQNPDGTVQSSAFAAWRLLTPVYRRTWLRNTPVGRRDLNRFLLGGWDQAAARPAAWLMSSCLLLRRAALRETGWFDERYFVYFADTDLCRRLWEKGWRVMQTPTSTFVHLHRRESAESLRVAAIHALDWLRYLWKWRRSPALTGAPQNPGELVK